MTELVKAPESNPYPFCIKCQKLVDSVTYETPVQVIAGWTSSAYCYSGVLIVTVECHGEKWQCKTPYPSTLVFE